MRASQTIDIKEIHISGAEGIYDKEEISKVLNLYLNRALNHSRGAADKIYFSIENIKTVPIKVKLLPIKSQFPNSTEEARDFIFKNLIKQNISKDAIGQAFNIIDSGKTMRGAAIISAKKGLRLDPNTERGVRVSRLGIDKDSLRKLNRRLSRLKINTNRVKEAIILASKVANHDDLVAELCVSDDPDYTTGYIASKELGYLRISNIKDFGDMRGGRIFFIKEDANISELIEYLERTPVLISL